MGSQGTADLDFGAFPGTDIATLTITGEAGIVAGSLVEAWLRPVDTVDHSVDEHMLEELEVYAANIVAGTGFTIYGVAKQSYSDPKGVVPMIYGTWKVAWVWN